VLGIKLSMKGEGGRGRSRYIVLTIWMILKLLLEVTIIVTILIYFKETKIEKDRKHRFLHMLF